MFSWLRRLTHSRLVSPDAQKRACGRCCAAAVEQSSAAQIKSGAVFILELYQGA